MKKKGRLRGIELLERTYCVSNNWSISKLYIELSSLMRTANELCVNDVDVDTRKTKLNQLIGEERKFLQKLIDSSEAEQLEVIIKTEDKEDFHEGDPIPQTPIKQEKTNLVVKSPNTRSSSRRAAKTPVTVRDGDDKASQDVTVNVQSAESGRDSEYKASQDVSVNVPSAEAANPISGDDLQEEITVPKIPDVTNDGGDTIAEDSSAKKKRNMENSLMEVEQEQSEAGESANLFEGEDNEADDNVDDDNDADFVDDENDDDYAMDDDDDDGAMSDVEAPKEPKGRVQNVNRSKKMVKNCVQNEGRDGELFSKKGQNYQCNECNEKFVKKMAINYHLKSHALGNIDLCPHCGLSFERERLNKHFQLKHRNESISPPNIDNKFVCGGCPRIFTNLFYMKTHRNSEHHNKEYECEYCQEYFANGNDHIKHLESHPYQCIMCNEIFDNKALLDIHLNHVHEEEQCLFCPICKDRFKFLSDLAEHYGTHVNKDNAHVCFVCRRQFSTLDILYDHLHIHSVYKQISCPNCPMRFKTVQAFVKHNDVIHKIVDENKGRCGGCGEIFQTKWLLKRHQQVEDDVTLKHCDECSMTFTCCRNLLSHKRSSHMTDVSVKKYVCDLCGKLFVCSGTLKRHVVTHSGIKPYKCDVCDKSYTTAMGRNQHKATHLNLRRFQCHICSKQFNINMHLKRHMKTHRAQRDFHCNICNKSFTQGGNLKVHQRIHTGVKPYKCEYCGKDFMYSGILNDHVKKHQQNCL